MSRLVPTLQYAGATDRGQARTRNEDAFLASPDVLAVADGMGGHAAGEVAARTAIDTLARVMRRSKRRDAAAMLTAAIQEANQIILERSLEYEQLRGMGTTVTAAAVRGGKLIVAHVGDSRAYLLRDGVLRQLTEDHSIVGEMLRQGRITTEQAAVHPQRAVITRALGTSTQLDVDVVNERLHTDDIVLLATDGLTSVLPDHMIASTLAHDAPLADLCSRLIAQANIRGGPDNITVIVARYLGLAPPDENARSAWRPVAATTLAFLLAAVLLAWGGYTYWSRSYYLGFSDNRVALWQGLPGSVFGLRLSRVYRQTQIQRQELPFYYQERLDQGIPITDTQEADRVISDIVLNRTPAGGPTGGPSLSR